MTSTLLPSTFGLATTSGGCPTVGIAGFTLGGGEGRLMEKYGAACDNLLSAQVVTVDGRQVEASPKSNPDLYWAIRWREAATLVWSRRWSTNSIQSTRFCREPSPIRPDAFQISCRLSSSFLLGPRMKWTRSPSCCHPNRAEDSKVDVCYCGDPRMGNDLLRPLRAFKPQDDSCQDHVLPGGSGGRWISCSAGCALPNQSHSSRTQRSCHCGNYNGDQRCAGQHAR